MTSRMQGTLSYADQGKPSRPCELYVDVEPVIMAGDHGYYETIGVRRSWGIEAEAIPEDAVSEKFAVHFEGEGLSVDGEAMLIDVRFDLAGAGSARYTGIGPLQGWR